MHVNVVELQRMDFALVHEIDDRLMRQAEWRLNEEPWRRRLTVEMRCAIYGKPHPERHIIRYPADWWQALKERFAPAWFRDRWPVKFLTHTATLKELYPDIVPVLPDRAPVMRFHVQQRPEWPVW